MIPKNNNHNEQIELLQKQLNESKSVAESERIAREKAEKNIEILSRQLNELQDKLDKEKLLHQDLRNESYNISFELHQTQELLKREKTKYLEEIYRSEKLNHALMAALDDSNEKNGKEINKLSAKLGEANQILKDSNILSHPMDGDNSKYERSTFGLAMSLKGSDYNNGDLLTTKIDPHAVIDNKEPPITYTLSAIKNGDKFLNGTSVKIDLATPNISGNKLQQFRFCEEGNDTVIKLVADENLAFTVAEGDLQSGVPFCLSPFNGSSNQEFVFKHNKLYSKTTGKVVTYIGGNVPFVMLDPSDSLEARQTFTLVLF